ncbi:Periplasmic copper-binding protein (NosD) [uncultured archaeon]|nr:Periplasmic copper-binding protein (NosD) [uncultured archaeon]
MPRLPVILFIAFLIWLMPIEGARTYIVDDDGFANYETFQDAINSANNGDTIYIKPGTYSEEVILNKSLSIMPLTGEKGPIVLRGDGKTTGITITSGGCSLEGLTLANFTGPGISIRSNGNVITKNNFETDHPGVLGVDSQKNIISGNSMLDCEGVVALRDNSSDNNVLNNDMNGGVVAVFIRDAGKNLVTENKAFDSTIGIWVMNSSNALVSSNDIQTKTYGIWVMNSSDCSFSNNAIFGPSRGIYLMNSSLLTANNNSVKDSKYGIALENVSQSQILQCSLENSTSAIGLAASNGNRIAGNRIANSGDLALEMGYSSGNRLTDNDVSQCERGFMIIDSPDNLLSNNRFQSVKWSLYVESSSREGYNNSIDESNLVDGNPIAYLYSRSGVQIQNKKLAHLTMAYCDNATVKDNSISNDAVFLFSTRDSRVLGNNVSSCYGIRLIGCMNNEIGGNRLIGNSFSGLFMASSDSNQIQENNASLNNQNGISLIDCHKNIIRDNVADHNFEAGIWLNLSNDNQIYQNLVSNNPMGLRIMYSSGNLIYHNNFLGNKEHSQDEQGNNSWDDGNVTGGNYLTGHVAKGNPSSDWPRIIKGGKADRYPFQEQNGWEKAEPK